ncbi:MAG: O-acetylhomoserine aminocarboxypropyltransferase/cysteine synthase family protein, partial [Chitinivibrionales bacterium]
LHSGYEPDHETLSRGVPLHRTTSYMFRDTSHAADLFSLKQPGNIYTRLMNPTQEVLEKRVAEIEGGAGALALASGTSAVFYSIINICSKGDEVVAAGNLYGGTYTMFQSILPQFGIKVNFVDYDKPQEFEDAVTERTKAVYAEALGNPALGVCDLEAVSKIAHKHHLPFIVDSTFTTPYLLRPFDYGADIVIHSLTKWLGGHGTAIGGIVVDSGRFDWTDERFPLYNQPDESYHGVRWAYDLGENNHLAFIMRMRLVPLRNLGAAISPDNAWMFLQGLETLHLRMERHSTNALSVAEFLNDHSCVDWVRYPGLKNDPSKSLADRYLKKGAGGMVVFGIKGGYDSAVRLIDNIELFSHLANVGDAKSLIIHPYSTTHAQLSDEDKRAGGLTPELIRLSIGIENRDDITGALDRALRFACSG